MPGPAPSLVQGPRPGAAGGVGVAECPGAEQCSRLLQLRPPARRARGSLVTVPHAETPGRGQLRGGAAGHGGH